MGCNTEHSRECRKILTACLAKQQKESKVDPIVLVIGRLQKLFPVAFPKKPAPKVPLKVGILDDLIARSVEIRITEEDLKKAIQAWCKSQRYWSVIIEGAIRVDLYGNPAGSVDTSGALQARSLLKKHQKEVQLPRSHLLSLNQTEKMF